LTTVDRGEVIGCGDARSHRGVGRFEAKYGGPIAGA